MAWARVQGATSTETSTATLTKSVTFGAGVGTGNTVCGVCSYDLTGSATVVSIVDDKGNSYNVEATIDDAPNGNRAAAFSRSNITGGPVTITVTLSTAEGYFGIIVDEFSGGSTSTTDARDVHGGQYQNGNAGTTDAITSGSFTTTVNGDLLYGVSVQTVGTVLPTAGTGFSTGMTSGWSDYCAQAEYRTQTTAGSTAATFNGNSGMKTTTWLIAMKPSGGVTNYTMAAGVGTVTAAGQDATLAYAPVLSVIPPLSVGRSRLLRRPWLRAMVSMPQPRPTPTIPPNAVFVPGHALLTNMLACYLPGMYAGVPVSGTGPTLANGVGGAGTVVSTIEGPALRSNTIGAAKGLTATAPSAFKTWTNFTVYWRGVVIGAGDQFCPLLGVSWSNTDTAPFFMINIATDTLGYAHLQAFYGDNTVSEVTPFLDVTGQYGSIIDVAATVTVGGSVTFYVNGAAVGTNTMSVISTSDANAKIVINQGIDVTNRSPNASCNMGCFWDRALSSGEILGLNTNPYAFLQTGAAAYPMAADLGTLTAAGQPVALRVGRGITAGLGTLTADGQPAALRTARKVVAGLGTLTLSGQPTTLTYSRKLSMAAGLGVLTPAGQAVNLVYSGAGSKTMLGGLGTITLAGQPVTVRYARRMPSGLGTLTLAGQPVTLVYSRKIKMAADLGTITLSGQPAILRYAHKMAAGLGTLTLSGQPVTLTYSRKLKMAAGLGTLTLDGQNVTLTKASSTARVIAAGLGTLTLDGQPVTLRYARKMAAGLGTVTLSGQPVTLRSAKRLNALVGNINLTGQATGLTYTHTANIRMAAGPGTLVLAGQSVGLLRVSSRAGQPGVLNFGRRVTINRW